MGYKTIPVYDGLLKVCGVGDIAMHVGWDIKLYLCVMGSRGWVTISVWGRQYNYDYVMGYITICMWDMQYYYKYVW